jgi:hypothetical protein
LSLAPDQVSVIDVSVGFEAVTLGTDGAAVSGGGAPEPPEEPEEEPPSPAEPVEPLEMVVFGAAAAPPPPPPPPGVRQPYWVVPVPDEGADRFPAASTATTSTGKVDPQSSPENVTAVLVVVP